jgi:hypothetical protein
MCHNLVRFIRVIHAIAIETSGSTFPKVGLEFVLRGYGFTLLQPFKGSARYDEQGCHCSCISMKFRIQQTLRYKVLRVLFSSDIKPGIDFSL